MFQSLFISKLKWYSLTDLGKQKLCVYVNTTLCTLQPTLVLAQVFLKCSLLHNINLINVVPVLCLVLTPTKGLLVLIQACESLFIDLQ